MAKIYDDNVELSYYHRDDFLDRLNEVQTNTEWLDVRQLRDLAIYQIPEGSEDEMLAHTKANGTDLLLLSTKSYESDYGIRTCAVPSLFQRITEHIKEIQDDPELICKLNELSVEIAKKLNINKNVKISVVEGKINSCVTEAYDTSLPTSLVFSEFDDYINRKYGNDEEPQFSGTWAYDESNASYILPVERNIAGTDYKIEINLKSSDTAKSAARFRAFAIGSGCKEIPLFTDINVLHRGRDGHQKIQQTIKMVESAIDGGMERLSELMTITIDNPVNCMKRVAKIAGLPKKDCIYLIEDFDESYTATAFRCYICLSQLLNQDLSPTVKERIAGDLAKLIGINWKAYDLSKKFEW